MLKSLSGAFETGSPNAAQAVALQRERLFVIPPVRLLGFYYFLGNWPVLQDKLERELETDELGVSHVGHREAKNNTLGSSSRPTQLSPLKIMVGETWSEE